MGKRTTVKFNHDIIALKLIANLFRDWPVCVCVCAVHGAFIFATESRFSFLFICDNERKIIFDFGIYELKS